MHKLTGSQDVASVLMRKRCRLAETRRLVEIAAIEASPTWRSRRPTTGTVSGTAAADAVASGQKGGLKGKMPGNLWTAEGGRGETTSKIYRKS